MSKHDQLLRDARAAHRLAQASRRRVNETLIRLEFPTRPKPIYIALDFHNSFSIVAEDETTGDLQGILIPFPRVRR
jgi:hypothetical protein